MEYYLVMEKKTDMNEPQKHVKWKKSDSKEHIVYIAIYINFSEKANLQIVL